LSTTTAVLTLPPGATGGAAITVALLNGFSGTIAYSVAGLPNGVTGSVSGNSLNVSVSSGATPGSYPLTITGTSGTLTAMGYLTLVVPAAVQQTQTLTFSGIASQSAPASVTLSATASSGLPVSFISSTPTVCSVSGSMASLLMAGTCTIDASQSGNASYTAAAPVTQSFSVVGSGFKLSAATTTLDVVASSNAIDVITVTPINGFSGTVGYSIAGLPSGVTSSFTGNSLQLSVSAETVAGTYPLVVQGSSGNSSAQLDLSLSVTEPPATVTVTATPTTHGGGALDLWSLGGMMALGAVGVRRRHAMSR